MTPVNLFSDLCRACESMDRQLAKSSAAGPPRRLTQTQPALRRVANSAGRPILTRPRG